jgi:non-heme chloroperoxidase
VLRRARAGWISGKGLHMPYITVGRENSGDINLHYQDHGTGQPVLLIHGFPLGARSWEKQEAALLAAGHRVISYDRRGFGDSSQPAIGYDYDTFAEDLNKLVTTLDLRDLALVGFSMGTGEVARYLGRYGSKRVRKAVFIAPLPPFLLKTPDNPGGADGQIFDGIKKAIVADRLAYLSAFLADFYNVDVYGGERVSEQVIHFNWSVAALASPTATLESVSTWSTDFRKDLPRVDVPALIVHGDADRVLPFSVTATRLHEALPGSKLVVIKGGPHGIIWTHAAIVNRELVEFLGDRR